MTVWISLGNGAGVRAHEPGIRKQGRDYSTCDAALEHKPKILIYPRTQEQIAQLCSLISRGTVVNLKDYVAVLANLLKRFCVDTCPDLFRPCDLPVGETNVAMTPLDFLEVKIIEGTPPPIDSSSSMTEEDKQLVLLVKMLAAHRIQSAREVQDKGDSYATKVSTQVRAACRKAGIEVDGEGLVNAERFTVTVDYLRLLCAADMFFTKFPKNTYSCMKVGTLTMSFKGMSLINNCMYLTSLTGQPWEKMIFYIFETGIIQELRDIVPGKWWKCPYYFGYQSSMNLLGGKFTYYSNTKNPKLHNMVQIVGLMRGSPRALNAYYVESPTALQVGQATFLLMASTGEGGYESARDASQFDGAADEEEEEVSSSAKASKFLREIPKNARFYADVANRSLKFAKRSADSLKVVREKSFGKWIKDIDVDSLCEAFYERMNTTGRKGNPEPDSDDSDDDDN